MNTSELIISLRQRIEDEISLNYTDSKLIDYLNQSAVAIANLLKFEHIHRLFVSTGDKNVSSSGFVRFSDTFGTAYPLRNAISKVFISTLANDTNTGFTLNLNKFADLISYESGESDNLYYSNEAVNIVLTEKPASAYKPIAFIQDNKLYVKPFYSNQTVINISYYREPFKHIASRSNDISFVGSTSNRVVSAGNINFLTAGYEVGQLITISGANNTINNGKFEILEVTDTFLVIDYPPTTESAGATISIDTTDNLGSNLNVILLDYAEYLAWTEDNKLNRSKNAYSSALNQINTLNGR